MAVFRVKRFVCSALTVVSLLAGGGSHAGGPLLVRSDGVPFVWSTLTPISYRTDNGPLSASVSEATARARVAAMFSVWQNVTTSNISYARATTNGGFINAAGAFVGGDIDTLAEYDAVAADCSAGNQSPVIYDADGSLFRELGLDETSVIGFAGPCAVNATRIIGGKVMMNGLFQDGLGAPVPDLSEARFNTAIIHEIGHFSGLDHSQVNVNCLNSCGAEDEAGLPTMFPFLIFASQGTLSVDDIAWISRLYPQTTGGATFAGTHGTISGVVHFSDGQSHAQGVNVIARRWGSTADERINAVSVVSGYRFTGDQGNPILNTTASPFGSRQPGDIGLFEIPVPAGTYTIQAEYINSRFVDGSSIGPVQIPMPGTAPPPAATITVGASSTASGNNIQLMGTAPRFDQFEGP